MLSDQEEQIQSNIDGLVTLLEGLEGPWTGEPHRVEFWIMAYPCLVSRGPLGGLCGYIGIYPGHPWFGIHYDDISPFPEVHGSLTYSNKPTDLISHIGDIDGPDVEVMNWWIGFDCSHAFDTVPRMPSFGATSEYRTIDYVRRQIISLVAQAEKASEGRHRIMPTPTPGFKIIRR